MGFDVMRDAPSAPRLTKEACRAARALLGLNTRDLAQAIEVSPTTISRLETGYSIRPRTERRIVQGLKRLGVEITDGDGGGTGAWLRFPNTGRAVLKTDR